MYGKIIGTGSFIPENRVSNQELSAFIETNDEWIKERTGIGARHVMQAECTSDMATEAAKRAIEDAGISPEEIDMIIVSTVSADVLLPNMACVVQSRIGAVNATCFDMNAACTGFMMAYNTAQSFMHANQISTALIIGAEGLSKLMNWEDRSSAILFGDGAGAAILRKDESAVFETVMHADGNKGGALTYTHSYANRTNPFSGAYESLECVKSGHDYIEMDGRAVFEFAVTQVPRCIKELLEKLGKTAEEIDHFLLHQANERIVSSVAKRLKVSIDKVPMNLMEYGNTSSASIPILLDELKREHRLSEGEHIIMAGFGAGLTWSATYINL